MGTTFTRVSKLSHPSGCIKGNKTTSRPSVIIRYLKKKTRFKTGGGVEHSDDAGAESMRTKRATPQAATHLVSVLRGL